MHPPDCVNITSQRVRQVHPLWTLVSINLLDIKASLYIPENRLNFPTTKDFKMRIFMKLVYQYMAILVNFSPTSSHLHPLQAENCDSNSRFVVDEDDNDKFRLERVNASLRPDAQL